ncbi:MAG: hypothetical protein IBJ11_03190 [Phycisphaerales bacterium]|nr:hypothetical protein [Phycisphaerales bacterium]
MRTLPVLFAAAGLMLGVCGCDRKESPTPSPAPTPAPAPGSNPSTPPKPAAPAEAAKPAEGASDQSTPEGAIRLFLGSMQRGDITTAVSLCDPTSPAYETLAKLARELAAAKERGKSAGQDPTPIITGFLAGGYRGATFASPEASGDRAKALIKFANRSEPVQVDLTRAEGKWYILYTDQLFAGDASGLPKPTAPAAPRPASDTPASTPAPATGPAGVTPNAPAAPAAPKPSTAPAPVPTPSPAPKPN